MADVKKITKKDKFESLKAILEGRESEISTSDLIDFIDTEIDHLTQRAAKEKQRSEERKAKGDALRETVKSVLTETFQSIDEIFSEVLGMVEDQELTKPMIQARLGQLYRADLIDKEVKKVEGGRQRTFYRLATDEDVEAVD